MTREDIYIALFQRLSACAEFITASRRMRHWSDVAPADQPALFQCEPRQIAQRSPGLDTVWLLPVDAYVYVNTGADRDMAPGRIMNPLLDAISAALAPDNPMTNKCTLGGLVVHCWIEGEIETDEGALGDQGVAIIPIVIKATGL